MTPSGAGVEVERRFLVNVPAWSAAAADATRERLVQVYLSAEQSPTVRVRLTGESAVLTVKGPPANGARAEIECPVDIEAARALLEVGLYVGAPVEKTRSTLRVDDLMWQVDQFEGVNAGLLIAEVEFTGEARERAEWESRVSRMRPEWLRREITGDPRFANSRLALRPFASWPASERRAIIREMGAES